jgi:hypothetical protein
MEANDTVRVLVAMGIAEGRSMSDLQEAIRVEWLKQKREARTPEQRKASAAKAKATRAERAKYKPTPIPAGYVTPYEQEAEANRERIRQAMGEEGWKEYQKAHDNMLYAGAYYTKNALLRQALGERKALDVLDAVGLDYGSSKF